MAGASAELTLPPVLSSIPEGRSFVRDCLASWDLGRSRDAELLATELLTNGVVHARTPVTLRLVLGDGRIRVEVRDRSPVPGELEFPEAGADRLRPATSGRGLMLVGRVSRRHGVDRDPGGKTVWAEVDTGTVRGC